MTGKHRKAVTIESRSNDEVEYRPKWNDSRRGCITRIPVKRWSKDEGVTLDEFEDEQEFVKSYHPHTKTRTLGEYYDSGSEYAHTGRKLTATDGIAGLLLKEKELNTRQIADRLKLPDSTAKGSLYKLQRYEVVKSHMMKVRTEKGATWAREYKLTENGRKRAKLLLGI